MRAILLGGLVTIAVACGGDDDDASCDDCDAAPVDGATAATDGGPTGTQQLGDFCEILQEGGPFCAAGLDCCDEDNICREPSDCPSGDGFLPCAKGSDCPSAFLCCQVPSMTFCTKQSACSAYDGTVIP